MPLHEANASELQAAEALLQLQCCPQRAPADAEDADTLLMNCANTPKPTYTSNQPDIVDKPNDLGIQTEKDDMDDMDTSQLRMDVLDNMFAVLQGKLNLMQHEIRRTRSMLPPRPSPSVRKLDRNVSKDGPLIQNNKRKLSTRSTSSSYSVNTRSSNTDTDASDPDWSDWEPKTEKQVSDSEWEPEAEKQASDSEWEPRNVKSINRDNEAGPSCRVMVSIGSASVPARLLTQMDWSSPTVATRKLLTEVFTREVLATHSLSGRPSPAFPCKPAKKQLDPEKVNDIVQLVSGRCEVSPKLVRTIITTKCADESKMYRTRQQNDSRRKPVNRENIPPLPHFTSSDTD